MLEGWKWLKKFIAVLFYLGLSILYAGDFKHSVVKMLNNNPVIEQGQKSKQEVNMSIEKGNKVNDKTQPIPPEDVK